MWTYHQCSGELFAADGELVGRGYAGCREGKNNPGMEALSNIGPLPTGIYTLRPPINTTLHGPYVLWLEPHRENNMFQRGDFGIHGDSIKKPGTASHGCIIMPRSVRVQMWESGDHQLLVLSGEEV